MGWVTLDDGQHVYIGSGGKVLATRGAISNVSGGGERGRALAMRSKTAIGGVSARTARAIEHARAAGPSLREQADRAKATGWRGQRLSGDMPRESRNKNLAMIRGWTQEQTRKYVGGITNKFAQRGVKAGEGIALPQDMASNRWKVYSHAEVKKAIQRSIVRHGTGKKYDAYLPG